MWVPNLCEFFCWFQNFCLNFNGSCSSLGFAKKTKKKHQSKKDHILVAKNSDGRQEDPQILYMETLSPCVVPSRQWFGCQLLLPLNFTPIMHEFSSSEPDSWGGDPFQETLNKSPRLKKQTYPTKILMDFASNAQSRRFVWALELLHSKNCVSCSQFCSPHPQVPLTHRSLPRWLCHLRSQPRCRHLNHWSKLLFSKSYTLLAIQIDHTSPQFIVLNFKKSWTIQCNLAQGQNFFSSCGVHTRESKRAAN